MHKLLQNSILSFCRFARSNGFSVGITETLTVLKAADAVGVSDQTLIRAALRSVLCSSHHDWELFDNLFDRFWNSLAGETTMEAKGRKGSPDVHRLESTEQKTILLVPSRTNAELPETAGGKAVVGATAHERLKRADFSDISANDSADLERIAMRLLRQMSLRLSRRLRRSDIPGPVDLRRTIRLSISRGGDPIDLSFRHRRLQQLRLVILIDVSGSMNPYSLFLVRFAYALQKYFKRVDTFLFSTRLTDITSPLRTRNLQDALRGLSRETAGWSGGTRIGDSLRQLHSEHGHLLTRNTLFLILSDGWETGSPETLAAELGTIKRRVGKILWLNPLLGMEGYEPVTRGMSAALPYIDVFAPAHNLDSLLALEQHLRRA